VDSWGWIPGRSKIFLFSTTSRPVLGPISKNNMTYKQLNYIQQNKENKGKKEIN
jgi:hypothetical protein